MRFVPVFLVAVFGALGFVGGASAQNVVVNGTFNGDITTGWTLVEFQAGPSFDATRDCCGDANPGSLNTVPQNNGNRTAVQQCVAFSAATNPTFAVGGWVQVNSVGPVTAFTHATINAQFNTAADCGNTTIAGPVFTVGPSGLTLAVAPWALFETGQTTPVGAEFVRVFIQVQRTPTIDANFDHVFLISDLIFADGFE